MSTPLQIAQAQFDAYNARDLDAFMALFADTVEMVRMPSNVVAFQGKAALSAFYANERFNRPALRAELLDRIVMGKLVFDHERVWGVTDGALEMTVVFEISDGLIQKVWSFVP